MIKDSGFQATFLYFGLGQGIVIILLAFLLVAPKAGQVPGVIQNAAIFQTRRNYGPTEVIRQPVFWLMYLILSPMTMGRRTASVSSGEPSFTTITS